MKKIIMKKYLFSYTFASLFVAALLIGCGNKGENKENPVTENNAPAAENNADYLGTVGKAQKQAVKIVDLSIIQDAINLFHTEEDRYPESLEELTASDTYLPSLPELPKGIVYSYNPKTGKIKAVPESKAPPAPPVPAAQ